MSYFRRGMGDGPITDPSQLDNGTTVATTGPTRVDCSALPADSPFRQPGQVCADDATTAAASSNGGSPFDWLLDTIKSGGAAAQPAQAGMSDSGKLFLAGAAALAAYYLFRKKRA